ncbi:hypothetical protein FQN54_005133 [Arachnomyces sp. PD_36]|nr:hypothetical protein FQN54_005133 [Arachnomyces sp. PD_36]
MGRRKTRDTGEPTQTVEPSYMDPEIDSASIQWDVSDPTYSAIDEEKYADLQREMAGLRKIPGAFPRSDLSGSSATDPNARRLLEQRRDSGEMERTPPADRYRVPLVDLYNNPPDPSSEHLRQPEFLESETDSDQWRRVRESETDERERLLPVPRGVDSDQWRRVGSPDPHVRISPDELQHDVPGRPRWDPPSEPVSNLVRRGKGKEPLQQASTSPRGQVNGGNGRQVGDGRPRGTSAAGPSSAQHRRSPVGQEQRAPPGAPTGPRCRTATPEGHQNQSSPPPRRVDRKVAFEVSPGVRSPRVGIVQAATTRRRPGSGGSEASRQVPRVAKEPSQQSATSTSRATRQTSSSSKTSSQPTIPTITRVVQNPPAPTDQEDQQQSAGASPSDSQQEPASERPRRRTRTRSRRKKDPMWAAVCSKRSYVIVIVLSFLSLVGLLVFLLKAYKII